MVPDFVRLGFTAEIPLPNQGFPARFLVRASRQVAIYSPARLRCSSCNSSMLSRDLP